MKNIKIKPFSQKEALGGAECGICAFICPFVSIVDELPNGAYETCNIMHLSKREWLRTQEFTWTSANKEVRPKELKKISMSIGKKTGGV